MAEKVLIMGESGTGKSTSLRNCNPATTAIVNPVGKPLPFRNSKSFASLNGVTESAKIVDFVKKQVANGAKIIVIDDFQYILSVPYMERIKENGWDKWNDFGSNYFELIDMCKQLPDDVIVYYMTHTETLESGITTIKLIGKMLREKITIEGLYTIVLRTGVNEGKYYFFTQNNGKDTVKSPLGMFDTYAIENDLAYVDTKIRNYYEFDGAITDEEMAQVDSTKAVAEVEKPKSRSERRRAEATQTGSRAERRQAEAAAYVEKQNEVIDEIADGRELVPFDEVATAMEQTAPSAHTPEETPSAPTPTEPTTDAPVRRTRRARA